MLQPIKQRFNERPCFLLKEFSSSVRLENPPDFTTLAVTNIIGIEKYQSVFLKIIGSEAMAKKSNAVCILTIDAIANLFRVFIVDCFFNFGELCTLFILF